MWSVTYSPAAIKTLSRMDPVMARRIRSKVLLLAHNPRAPNNSIRNLTGIEGFRLRVGDWRVRFSRPDADTVRINRILNRKDAYR